MEVIHIFVLWKNCLQKKMRTLPNNDLNLH